MRYILDTNAISDLMRRSSQITQRANSLQTTDTASVSVISIGELFFGIRRLPMGRRRTELENSLQGVLAPFVIEALRESAAKHYEQIKVATSSKGKTLGENDLWIAAHAMDRGATLVTRDNDFAGYPSLPTEDWTR